MDIKGKAAIVTGAGSGIGRAVALELAQREVAGLALVDKMESVVEVVAKVNDLAHKTIAYPFIGDVTQSAFRTQVFDEIERRVGVPRICIPCAGITRDGLSVKVDKVSGNVALYPEESFRLVLELNLVASTYWVLEMVGRIAADRFRRNAGRWNPKTEELEGTAIFIGSVSSLGNKGQIAYSATKRGLEAVAATLMKEAMFYGVKSAVIHPGYTDTPMVRVLGDEFIEKNILPHTQLKRLVRPEEIASSICFMISTSALTGELWCDAGWHAAP